MTQREMSAGTGGPESTSARLVMTLDSDCTIRSADVMRERLLAAFNGPGPLVIDGAAVERVDAAGLQLLVACALDCLESGREYVLQARSDALNAAIRLAGVGALLDHPGTPVTGTQG